MDPERIQRIEGDLSRADLSARTRTAVEYARRQSRTGPAGARQAWAALREAGFDALAAKEIAFTVALTDFANRVSTIAAVPVLPMERLPEQWATKALRPLLNWLTARRRSRGSATPAPPVDPAQPYGRVVAAYAGSPIAKTLADTLDAMWSSPHLTRRCKLLVFAVISRGLPCEVCELEVGDVLLREGMDAATLSQVLSHLDAPGLSEIERRLLPFARETLWYEPAKRQRQARVLRDQLTPEQFVEAIGVTALANGLCRMAAVAMEAPA